mgnify:CR=1 FL=1
MKKLIFCLFTMTALAAAAQEVEPEIPIEAEIDGRMLTNQSLEGKKTFSKEMIGEKKGKTKPKLINLSKIGLCLKGVSDAVKILRKQQGISAENFKVRISTIPGIFNDDFKITVTYKGFAKEGENLDTKSEIHQSCSSSTNSTFFAIKKDLAHAPQPPTVHHHDDNPGPSTASY